MATRKFQNLYRIPSARAPWHTYDNGAYFVTVCTAHRNHYFGEISGGKMHLTSIGQIVASYLQTVSEHYRYAKITLSAIMPNHIHAIVLIDRNKIPSSRSELGKDHNAENAKMQEIARQSGWLSVCIGGIKSAVTKYAHENKIEFGWQSRFHDHIIRETNEMSRIANYIENNVCKWDSDSFYSR